jgi:hypothetical protein
MDAGAIVQGKVHTEHGILEKPFTERWLAITKERNGTDKGFNIEATDSFPSSPSPTATKPGPHFLLADQTPHHCLELIESAYRRVLKDGRVSARFIWISKLLLRAKLLCLGFDLSLHLGADENFLGHTDSSCFDGCHPAVNPLSH